MIVSTFRKRATTLTIGALILAASIYFILHALHFFRLTPEHLGKYLDVKWILLLHISGGAVALLTGPFQFWEEFRNRDWKWHRILGKAYLVAILVSAPCAVFLAFTKAYEVSGAYAFSLQVWLLVWITSTFLAYRYVRLKKFKLHKEWMVRSYLATLAFVVSALLLKIPWIAALGSFAEVSPGLFWICWAFPLFLYDIVLSAQRKQ